MITIALEKLKKSRFLHIDNQIMGILSSNCFLAGGAVRSVLNGETPSDYDLFFTGANHAIDCSDKLLNLGFTLVFNCPEGKLKTFIKNKIKVQVITPRFYATLFDAIDSFDFTATMAAIDGENLYFDNRFLKAVRKKYLAINRLTYPVATTNRVFKYKNKGYYIKDALVDIVERTFQRDPDIIDIGVYYID